MNKERHEKPLLERLHELKDKGEILDFYGVIQREPDGKDPKTGSPRHLMPCIAVVKRKGGVMHISAEKLDKGK